MKFLISLCFAALMTAPALADDGCFLVTEGATGAVLLQQGDDCNTGFTPASSFKVPLALMGFDSGVLVDADNPAWPYKAEYKANRDTWKVTTGPAYWLKESVLWYSRQLTRTLGETAFAEYVTRFKYGNMDVSGGLTQAWLSSSLKISPVEQEGFVRAMLSGTIDASPQALATTLAIMPVFPLANGWRVHGKTGTAYPVKGSDVQLGWFIGWAENGERTVLFAKLLRDAVPTEGSAGPRARDIVLADLATLLSGQ